MERAKETNWSLRPCVQLPYDDLKSKIFHGLFFRILLLTPETQTKMEISHVWCVCIVHGHCRSGVSSPLLFVYCFRLFSIRLSIVCMCWSRQRNISAHYSRCLCLIQSRDWQTDKRHHNITRCLKCHMQRENDLPLILSGCNTVEPWIIEPWTKPIFIW